MAWFLLVAATGFAVTLAAGIAFDRLGRPDARVEGRAGRPPAPAVVAEPRGRSQTPRLEPPTPASPARDLRPFSVDDLETALDVASSEVEGAPRDAAIRFLEQHGPDEAAYDRLAQLDGAHAGSPAEAVEILTARSRLRRTLCAAWADGAKGQASVRLGCPGTNVPNN